MNSNNIQDLFNKTAYDVDGDKLGSVKEIFIDDNSGQPTFVEVNHGLFGMSSSIVPLRGHSLSDNDLVLAFHKQAIKDAPSIDSGKALTADEQNAIYRHYGVDKIENRHTYNRDNGTGRRDVRDQNIAGTGAGVEGTGVVEERNRTAAGRDHGRGVADHDNSGGMIRSEEQLDVNKERVNAGEVRLRKYVVTDTEQVEVPVTREEVQVERTPVTDAEAAKLKGKAGLDEDEASVTLHEERVTVNKETVPVEKVNLNKTQVEDTKRISEDVRKERIETDGDGITGINRDRRDRR